MALIKITKEDLLKSQPPEEGWHLFKIQEIEEVKSKKGDSMNTFFSCIVADKEDSSFGRESRYMIAGAGNPAFNMNFHCAVLGMTIDEIVNNCANDAGEIELNTDGYIGKKFWGEIGIESYTDNSGKTKTSLKIQNMQPESQPPF